MNTPQCPECKASANDILFEYSEWHFEDGQRWGCSVKPHDLHAAAWCQHCGWRGKRADTLNKERKNETL